jgi:hypothetical protein
VPDTNLIETAITRIDAGSPPDAVLEAIDKLDAIRAWLRERDAELDAALREWLRVHGTLRLERPDGSVLSWRLAKKKTTRCVDVPGAIQALLEVVEGDFERCCEFLAAQPVKYGSASKVLNPAQYELLFVTTEEDEVKPTKLDSRFLPAGKKQVG